MMRIKTILYSVAAASIVLLSPPAAYAGCYEDCMGGCRNHCRGWYADTDLLNACESGCGFGCSDSCDHMETAG